MSLLGQAALAMWWDIAPEVRADFEHWHAHEHFPERLGIPGFCRGTRWSSATDDQGIFVMYEMAAYETLLSSHYVARLNAPTPWSTRMMPHHRNMVRSQCRVLESRGGGVAGHVLTLRLSATPGRDDGLRVFLRALIDGLALRPGLTGAHLLKHETPPLAATAEQKMRGTNDRYADWVLVICGYDAAALQALLASDLAATALMPQGAAPGQQHGLYRVSYSATPADVADVVEVADIAVTA